MSKFVVYLTNGDELRFENHSWSEHRSGSLEIMVGDYFGFVMLIAHHEWKLVKPLPPTLSTTPMSE